MITAAVQAGGESSRMGQDKARMIFLGRPLVERVIRRVMPVADEVLVTTNQPLPLTLPGVRLVADVIPGRGALVGLFSALSAASHEILVVVACDMPFVSPALLQHQIKLINEHQIDVVIPQSADGLEPFHAVYRRESCLKAVAEALQQQRMRMISWFDDVQVLRVPREEVLVFDPNELAFHNVNTPEEFAAAETLARSEQDHSGATA